MTHLILIIDHVSQSLIVNHADENVDLHFTTIRTTVHPLCAVEVVPNCNTSIHNTIQYNLSIILSMGTLNPTIPYH